jgi:hypothetical protein
MPVVQKEAKILVPDAHGFIAAAAVKILVERGFNVIGVACIWPSRSRTGDRTILSRQVNSSRTSRLRIYLLYAIIPDIINVRLVMLFVTFGLFHTNRVRFAVGFDLAWWLCEAWF